MRKENVFVFVIAISVAFASPAFASIFDKDDSGENTMGQVYDSLGGSDLGSPADSAPVEEAVEVLEEVKAEETKVDNKALKDEVKESADVALSNAAEIEKKAGDINAQIASVDRLQKQLESEKEQLETMKSEFCQNFPKDCGKVSGGVSAKSSGFFGKSKD